MNHPLPLLISCLGLLSIAFAEVAPAPPNVLLICIDDLRPELNCFGVDYIKSPHIDKLAEAGRPFFSHYVQAPTCGASRFALLTGRYGPAGNGALMARGKRLTKNPKAAPPSLPAWFREHGYTTVSVGKVSHHPGGRGGADWDDNSELEMPLSWDRHLLPSGPWRHPRGAMHGLANGEIRSKSGSMDVLQSTSGSDMIYPDGLITNEALHQLGLLAKDRSEKQTPFFLAVGIIRPHLPFGAPAKYMEPYKNVSLPPIPHPQKPKGKTTWHGSGEFMKYNRWSKDPRRDEDFADRVRRHYAACVSYADAQVGRLIAGLDQLNLRQDTIIVIWGDHGWHLGEHAVWGKHTLFEESLRSPLIITVPGANRPGVPSESMVETIDVFPTLCDLTKLMTPPGLAGRSLKAMLDQVDGPSRPALAYHGSARTIRDGRYRLIRHGRAGKSSHIELYDHRSDPGECENIAKQQPEVVKKLSAILDRRLKRGNP